MYFVDLVSLVCRCLGDRIRGTTNKVRAALKHRLELQSPFLATWHQAMALGAQPQNLPTTLHNIAIMVDDVWYYAGDRSTDVRLGVSLVFLNHWFDLHVPVLGRAHRSTLGS